VGAAALTASPVTNNVTVSDPGDSVAGDKSANDSTTITTPDLTITKTHTGSFSVGTNGTYTINVTNNGTADTTGQITVTDPLPAGLGFVAAGSGGGGWTCTNPSGQTVSCTNAGPITKTGGNSSFPLVVSVATGAFPSVTNTVTVADAGDVNNADKSSAPDLTNVTAPDLTITKTHPASPNFKALDTSDTYTIKVTNNGNAPASGSITVTDTLPSGLTFVAAGSGGSGWTCTNPSGQTVTCTNPGPITAGANSSFPLNVSVAPAAYPSVTNNVTVSDANDPKTTDKSASDPTNVDNALPAVTQVTPVSAIITQSASITIKGTGFNSSTKVTFNGANVGSGTASPDGTTLTITIPAAQLNAAGQVNISVTNPQGGGGTSTNLQFTVVDFSLTQDAANPGTIQITGGTPAMVKLDLATNPTNAPLPADVNFTCAFVPAGLAGATCALDTSTIAKGNTAGNVTATIRTTGSNGNMTSTPPAGAPGQRPINLLELTAATLAAMMGIFATYRRRALSWRRFPAYLALALLALTAASLTSCASQQTPKGPASVTVTSTSGGVSHTTTININVN